jgi:hypothetical protein
MTRHILRAVPSWHAEGFHLGGLTPSADKGTGRWLSSMQ